MRLAARFLPVVMVLLVVTAGGAPAAGESPGVLLVTSSADDGGTCPDAVNCTLRAAIAAVNAGSPQTVIRFDPAVFPQESPTAIAIGATPLPPLMRAGAIVDGTGAGVVIRNGAAGLATPLDGLRLTGAGSAVRGITFEGFTGSCVVADAPNAAVGGAAGNRFDGCGTAILAAAPGVSVEGNVVTGESEGGPQGIGIRVIASDVRIGRTTAPNLLDGLAVSVIVAADSGPVDGTVVEGNLMQQQGGPCVVLEAGTSDARVTANAFTGCSTGVAVSGPAAELPASSGNTIRGNTFASLAGLAVDLDADGFRNQPGTPAANGGVGYPQVTRATQAGVQGVACPGCTVELYLAHHTPGGALDYGSVPLGPPVVADGSGQFSASLPVSAGQWVTALATDDRGNTSEFGPPARVGAGAVVCGNVLLLPGWNHVAYFGSQPLVLGNVFPSPTSPAVTAIYQAVDGSTAYLRWLAATVAGRTLTVLEPGREYWFLATAPVSLEGGFSVSFPVPVELAEGWNDLAYIGGSADPRDAFASLGDRLQAVAKWDSVTQRWLRYGDGSAPDWAKGFNEIEPCGVYQVKLREPATLVPLQP
ncbi:MAG: hypothetical protein KatS3mg062_0177 [Tepidiforma sp.]|nr:MAG: hypothetical protein KatS3mg062_0177 [Tepidiforma sp.]